MDTQLNRAKFSLGAIQVKAFFYIVLEEGKKRQIRRMAQKIGLEIKTLRRVRIGKLKLGDLKPGEYRKIRTEDIL